jgi:hypothetical protein
LKRGKSAYNDILGQKTCKSADDDSLRMKTLQKSNSRNMTGGEGLITCYHGNQQKKPKFLKQKRGKSTVGNILKNENAAIAQLAIF